MAWSETMFIIQHFYNVFDIDKRLTDVEYKSPLVAKSVDGLPELPEGTTVNDLTPGTLWFIKDNNFPSMISAVSVLNEDNTFADPVPFSIDLNNISLESDLQQIAGDMGLTAQNYYDIIKSMLEILKTVPVKYGGTGITNISKNGVLIGDVENKFREIGFDSAPTQRSENLVNSGALYSQFGKMAEKDHASAKQDYGVGTSEKYGHLRITDDYETLGTDPTHTAVSVSAINQLLGNVQNFLNMFQIIDEDTLFSGCISAYRPKSMSENELRLIDSYFSVKSNNTGNYTLIIN